MVLLIKAESQKPVQQLIGYRTSNHHSSQTFQAEKHLNMSDLNMDSLQQRNTIWFDLAEIIFIH